MTLGPFKCWRLWYQGPPGARGCYVYLNRVPRPRLWFRWLGDGFIVGTRGHHVYWCLRWPK